VTCPIDTRSSKASCWPTSCRTAALNRDVWKGMESVVRHLAQRRGELYVVTGPAFHARTAASPEGMRADALSFQWRLAK